MVVVVAELSRLGSCVSLDCGGKGRKAVPSPDALEEHSRSRFGFADEGPRGELRLEIIGSDRPGIVHEISEALADRGINVDELRPELMSAPMSGELLFLANAQLMVPVDINLHLLRQDREALPAELTIDFDLDRRS